jgi:hypothetical protein
VRHFSTNNVKVSVEEKQLRKPHTLVDFFSLFNYKRQLRISPELIVLVD